MPLPRCPFLLVRVRPKSSPKYEWRRGSSRGSFRIQPDFAGGLDGVDDARVARTAAQMAVQRFPYLFPALSAIALQQSRGAYHNAGNAKTALDGALQQKGFTQYATQVVGHTLERDHLSACHVFRLPQTREHGLAIHQNGAASASAFRRAAVLGETISHCSRRTSRKSMPGS